MKRPEVIQCLAAGLLPLVLWGAIHWADPFGATVAEGKFSLHGLTAAQRSNIAVAAARVDGRVLRPGEVFSFNTLVGPRTHRRGYRSAPAYLDKTTLATPGGGICLLSSALYRLALASGLLVSERHAHQYTVRTVLPGFDATVWYGQADLRFVNTSGVPLRLAAGVRDGQLAVALRGRYRPAVRLSRRVRRPGSGALLVEVFRRDARRDRIARRVSQDRYLTRARARGDGLLP